MITIALLTFAAAGQDVRKPERGLVAGASYALSNIETINTTNGNLMLNIPLATLPAGVGPARTFSLRYNSKLWDNKGTRTTDGQLNEKGEPVYFNLDELSQSPEGGWTYSSFFRLEVINRLDTEPIPACGTASDDYQKSYYKWKIKMHFPDGSVHELRPLGQNEYFSGDGYFSVDPNGNTYDGDGENCTSSSLSSAEGMTYYSTDGSFLRLVVGHVQGNDGILSAQNPWTLFFPDGSKATNNSTEGYRLYDRNGNYVTATADQFGRNFTFETDPSDTTKQYVKQKGAGGEILSTTIKWKTVWVRRKYDAAPGEIYCYPWRHEQEIVAPIGVIDYVELPPQTGGLRYVFAYNASASQPSGTNYTAGTGELKQITMPSGAVVEYRYATDAITGTLPGAQTLVLNSPTRKDLTHTVAYDGASPTSKTDTWLYDLAPGGSVITGPGGEVTEQWFGDVWQNGTPFKGKVYCEIQADGTKIERIYQNNRPENLYFTEVNAFVKTEFTSLKAASGSYGLTSAKVFDYDKNGNPAGMREYDWMPYSSVPRTNGMPTGLPSNASVYLRRKTITSYYNGTPDSQSTVFNDPDSYHLPGSPRLLNLVSSSEIQDPNGSPKARSEMAYDFTAYSSNTTAGNITQTKNWDSFKNGAPQNYTNPLTSTNSVATSATYNLYGMPATTTDANGRVTQITYGNVLVAGVSVTSPYPAQTVVGYGTAVARTSTTEYDFHAGLVTNNTDTDNDLTTRMKYDALGRPVKVIDAANTSLESWTVTDYDDQERRIIVRSDLDALGDGKKVSVQHFDQLGRLRLLRTLENAATEVAEDETDGIKIQTRYGTSEPCTFDTTRSCSSELTSRPYRAAYSYDAGPESTMGWTLTQKRVDGGQTETEAFSGAALPKPFIASGYNTNSTGRVKTSIDAAATTVEDQAGKLRRSVTNGLGWTVRVDEPTSDTVSSLTQATYYSYDAMGKMVHVLQGNQNRFFMYDSLGRLLRVKQPEQEVNTALNTSGNPENNGWSAGFTYDDNGNVLTRTDAKDTTITQTYDALNRVVTKTYEDGTPTVTNYYDGNGLPSVPAHSRGKLTKVHNSVSETQYKAFDIMGRLLESRQVTDNQAYTSAYQYNLSGNLIEETYPSTRAIKYQHDPSGDIARVAGKPYSTATERTYATAFSYNSAGSIEKLRLGNNTWESTRFNARSQAVEIALGHSVGDGGLLKLNFEYGETQASGTVDPTKNSGNLGRQTINFAGLSHPLVQSYKYDQLNRLTEAVEKTNSVQTWKQTYGYDIYGNRNAFSQVIGSTELSMDNVTLPSVDTATNRFSPNQGYSYDKSGNITADPVSSGRSFVFDGDNRQKEVKNSANVVVGTYFYDGNGKRVKKVTDLETTIFVYNGTGNVVAEYSTQTPAQPKVTYTTTDQLGSPRVLTDNCGQVVSRRDFMPFGEELYADGSHRKTTDEFSTAGHDAVRKRFTGYEKDIETGLDFAKARYYNNQHGRYTTVDPLPESAEAGEPQSWNRYVYVSNNPLRYVDPSGEIKDDPNKRLARTYEAKTQRNPYTGDQVPVRGVATSNGKKFDVELGELTTKDGKTKIEVTKNMSGDRAFNTQCHGLTFTNGKYAIDNLQVDNVLKGEGFAQLGTTDKARIGDVAIYRDANGKPLHSATVSAVNSDGTVSKVSGLGGLEPKSHTEKPEEHFKDKAVAKIEIYRRGDDTRTDQEREKAVGFIQTFKK